MLAWPSKTCFTRPATRQTQVSYVGSRRTAVMERGMWERSFSSWRNPVVRIFWMIGSCAAVSPGSRRWKQSAARLRVDFPKLVSTNVCRSPPSSQRAESYILDDVRAAPQEVPLTLRRLKCYVASLEWLLEELQFLGISQPTRRLALTWHLGVRLQSLMGFLARLLCSGFYDYISAFLCSATWWSQHNESLHIYLLHPEAVCIVHKKLKPLPFGCQQHLQIKYSLWTEDLFSHLLVMIFPLTSSTLFSLYTSFYSVSSHFSSSVFPQLQICFYWRTDLCVCCHM